MNDYKKQQIPYEKELINSNDNALKINTRRMKQMSDSIQTNDDR